MKTERVIFAAIVASGVALSLGALALSGARPASSVAAGACIAVVNLWALRTIVRALVEDAAGTRASARSGFLLVPKMLGLVAVVAFLLARNLVSLGPFVVGYSALPIGVAIGALVCKKGPD